MPSTHAWPSFNLAAWSVRVKRAFSRATHSACTSRAKRSSKLSEVQLASCCWAVQAAARAVSFSCWSWSIVGGFSIGGSFPLRVDIASSPLLTVLPRLLVVRGPAQLVMD